MAAHQHRFKQPNMPASPLVSGPQDEATGATDGILSRQALVFIARFRALLLIVPYLLLRAFNTHFLGANQDIGRYFDAATHWLSGKTPYSQFPLEYPPGALPLFALPKMFLGVGAGLQDLAYNRLFALEMVLFDCAILWLIGRLSTVFWPESAALSLEQEPAPKAMRTLAQMGYILWTGMLHYLGFERYDLAFACFVLAFVTFAVEGRRRIFADGMLALSIWVKLVSVAFVPLYLAFLFFQDSPGKTSPKIKSWLLGQGALRVGCLSLMLLALFGPFYWAAQDSFFDFVRYHSNRGVQVESTASSLMMLWHSVFGTALGTRFVYGATEVTNGWTMSWARFSPYATAIAIYWITTHQARAMARATKPTERMALLVQGVLALTLGLLFFNKVFSPQYMLWLGPLVAAAALTRPHAHGHHIMALFVANALTSLEIFFYYINVLQMQPLGVAILLVRNLLVGGLMVAFVSGVWQGEAIKQRQAILDGAKRLLLGSWTSTSALILCALWVFAANMSETTANDIWIQLRSGQDMWRTMKLPYTEVYSATVSGRPFIAHEWLSGGLFWASSLLLGDAGLSVMTALVALTIFCCMYVTFPKAMRQSVYYLPVLLYLNYLIAFRLLARPHIFTILAQAFMVMAIERWRQQGGIKQLIWLVPMQLVWINLHGAALFGPALMGMVTGGVLLMVMVPQLAASESRRMSMNDVVQGGLITLAMCVACFVNPYGHKIVAFSVDLLQNEYAKNRVWEWTTPFLGMNAYYYWLYLFIFGLALVWTCLLLRIKQWPILDVAYTLLATYLGVRANRFMPDFAILSFPVIIRACQYACEQGLKPWAWRRQPWLDMGLATLLLANCFAYGYAHSAREHRPMFGWGHGGDMPYSEVALLKQLGIRGTIYNEYSDGSLIINKLTPTIKPVLDSRIDLYPLDFVAEYDQAYVNPQLFAQFLQRRHIDVVMLYKHRVPQPVLSHIAADGDWRLLSDSESRVLYVTHRALKRAIDSKQRS